MTFDSAEDRMAPVFGRKRGAVGPPEHFVLDVRPFAGPQRLENRRLLRRVRRAIRPRVVNQRVHLPADERGGRFVAKKPRARGVAERADPAEIDAVDRLGCRVEQQPYPFLAFGDFLARTHELRDVPRDAGNADDAVRCIENRREGDRDVDDGAVFAQPPRLEALDRPAFAQLAEESYRSRLCVRPDKETMHDGRWPRQRYIRRAGARRCSSS